jgi:hypothetical protein
VWRRAKATTFKRGRMTMADQARKESTLADGLECKWCGRTDDVDYCTVDGACDENGNSIGVPLCEDCAGTEQ